MFMQVVIKRFPGSDLKVALKAVKGAQEEKNLKEKLAKTFMFTFLFLYNYVFLPCKHIQSYLSINYAGNTKIGNTSVL